MPHPSVWLSEEGFAETLVDVDWPACTDKLDAPTEMPTVPKLKNAIAASAGINPVTRTAAHNRVTNPFRRFPG